MAECQVLPMWRDAISIARAFEGRGVTLKFPAFSRSGVRGKDGAVVFAMARAQVRVNDWGCSCPLWVPTAAGVGRGMDRASRFERLKHCRLAVHRGAAEGFLVDGDDAPATSSEVLALRVVKVSEEYWATWGAVAPARLSEDEPMAERALREESFVGRATAKDKRCAMC
jgi:hypothetical protein